MKQLTLTIDELGNVMGEYKINDSVVKRTKATQQPCGNSFTTEQGIMFCLNTLMDANGRYEETQF